MDHPKSDTERLTVDDDLVVTLDYILQLDNGEEIDNSAQHDPLEFLQGRGHIISGLEQALYGMGIGDEKDVVVAAADGYGEHDPEELQEMSRSEFPADLALSEGMSLRMRDPSSGEVFEAYVDEVDDQRVVLDFNHPLAGERLHFHVKLAGLRKATSVELDHGHVHAEGHAH